MQFLFRPPGAPRRVPLWCGGCSIRIGPPSSPRSQHYASQAPAFRSPAPAFGGGRRRMPRAKHPSTFMLVPSCEDPIPPIIPPSPSAFPINNSGKKAASGSRSRSLQALRGANHAAPHPPPRCMPVPRRCITTMHAASHSQTAGALGRGKQGFALSARRGTLGWSRANSVLTCEAMPGRIGP